MANFPFPTKISQESTHTFDQKAIIVQYGDGVQQRAAVGVNSRSDQWDIRINFLNLTERNTMAAFFDAHGLVQSFDWTPPNGTPTKWVFTTSLQEGNVGDYYNFGFKLMQVFE